MSFPASMTTSTLPPRPARPLPPRLSPRQRLRRVALIALAVCALPIGVSWLSAMTASANTALTINTIEWLRSNGGAGIASFIERIYYSLNAPATGGPGLKRLALKLHQQSIRHPPNITPILHPALPGEGVWQPTESWTLQSSPVQITQFRSDPLYPQMVAGVAWIDPRRTSIQLYAGNLEPDVPMANRGPEMVPVNQRAKLLATFNSGFKLEDAHGGWADNGQTYAPLVKGQATFVGYTNGTYNIVDWTGGPKIGPNIDFARQNLPLIVSNGAPNPQLANGALWGATLGNSIRVWRSGLGITARGDLIYAAANNQTAQSLAAILIHAGAVRAMQLDINAYWPSFNYYTGPNAANPIKLLPDMVRPANRYLTPDDRDFFAVYLKANTRSGFPTGSTSTTASATTTVGHTAGRG
ncbi:hypothetical protein [Conexibacter sp. DBS9H8]|uniref:hypothetical protein n=1 Tax=Conexibacter sp. DBS9H8 TaxID=2937801 RepID=UPI002010807E|nr:hypothetical protein [Conexibacter sp. DBS9H8]